SVCIHYVLQPLTITILPFSDSHAHHPYLHSFPTRRSSDLGAWCQPPVTCQSSCSTWTSARNTNMRRRLASVSAISVRTSNRKARSEEHTSELQSRFDLVCRLLLEKKKIRYAHNNMN